MSYGVPVVGGVVMGASNLIFGFGTLMNAAGILVSPLVSAVVSQSRAMVQKGTWNEDRRSISEWSKLEAKGDWTLADLDSVTANTNVQAETVIHLAALARGINVTKPAEQIIANLSPAEKRCV